MSNRIAIALVVVALVAGFSLARLVSAGAPTAQAPVPASAQQGAAPGALSAYRGAIADGLPSYVLFHSTTCASCIEMSKTVARVLPDYEGRVVLVDAIEATDASVAQLAKLYPFRYIPTSYFVDAQGAVVASHVGVLDEQALREQLDALVVAE